MNEIQIMRLKYERENIKTCLDIFYKLVDSFRGDKKKLKVIKKRVESLSIRLFQLDRVLNILHIKI